MTPITENTISAARKIGGDVTVIVAGTNCGPVSYLMDSFAQGFALIYLIFHQIAEKVSKIQGVSKVLTANNEAFKGLTAEPVTDLVLALQNQFKFTHILAGASAFGKNVAPRIAAKLDVSPISEIIDVKSSDTFVRTIYAGENFRYLILFGIARKLKTFYSPDKKKKHFCI